MSRSPWLWPCAKKNTAATAPTQRPDAVDHPGRPAPRHIRDRTCGHVEWEWHLFIVPVLVGGGKPSLPIDTRAELELLDERRFSNGVVYLRYRTRI